MQLRQYPCEGTATHLYLAVLQLNLFTCMEIELDGALGIVAGQVGGCIASEVAGMGRCCAQDGANKTQ